MVGGRYQLHTMLGRGATAAVWAGIDTRLDRPVAVKILDGVAESLMVQQIHREARTVARLAHPNIVAVFDVGTDGGAPFLVMELVPGDDLRRRLSQGPLDAAQAIQIAIQVCAALEAAHAADVVHGDIKPENILLTASACVKVCDFGIARLQQTGPANGVRSSTVVGTIEYMAPEQAAGGPVDTRTDLYALGCVLYAMLTGGPPFFHRDPMSVLWQQVHRPPEPVAARHIDIPPDLQTIVTRLLAKSPADRPDSAGQVRAQLASLPGFTARSTENLALTAQPAAVATARAEVLMPTRVLPALDPTRGLPPPSRVAKLGPAGIAAVAIASAVVTALVIAVYAAGPAVHDVAAPNRSGGTPAPTVAATPTASASSGTVQAVRAAIQTQLQAGQIDADDANDLSGRLDEVDRNLTRGRPSDAAQKLSDLRSRLSQLRGDGKITSFGFVAIVIVINRLAATLPVPGNGDGHH
jgi:eukaryotic-like serine/threonine-protein kinase